MSQPETKLYDMSPTNFIVPCVADAIDEFDESTAMPAIPKIFDSFDSFVNNSRVFNIIHWQWKKPICETKNYEWDDLYKRLSDEDKQLYTTDVDTFRNQWCNKSKFRRFDFSDVLIIVCNEICNTSAIYVYYIYVKKEEEPKIKEFINKYS